MQHHYSLFTFCPSFGDIVSLALPLTHLSSEPATLCCDLEVSPLMASTPAVTPSWSTLCRVRAHPQRRGPTFSEALGVSFHTPMPGRIAAVPIRSLTWLYMAS